MRSSELIFQRPSELEATATPEDRGFSRDGVRLLVTTDGSHYHTQFTHLPDFLQVGDLLVVNDSATRPASLPAWGEAGTFIVNLCTHYGRNLWLAEPRRSPSRPGPLPLRVGQEVWIAGLPSRLISEYPGLPRLLFLSVKGDLRSAMESYGRPIRYGYLRKSYPLEAYQTIFARVPGSVEMPSAARPFTPWILEALRDRGVEVAPVTLHTGVSSLEIETESVEEQPLYPEPFRVPAETAQRVNLAISQGRRVIAVGTTVVRALETAWDGQRVRPGQGFTRSYIHPGRGVKAVDGLLTGFHDPGTTHLALLCTLIPLSVVREAYSEAVERDYLWHEFGDSQLILT